MQGTRRFKTACLCKLISFCECIWNILIKTSKLFYYYLHLLLWNLFPGHKFLLLQFLLGYPFLLRNVLFWFSNNLLFPSKDHLSVAGRASVGVDRTTTSVSPLPGWAHWSENLHLGPKVQHNSLHFGARTVKMQPSFRATNPVLSPSVWPGTSPNSSAVTSEWHTMLLWGDSLQILDDFLVMHTLHGLDSFTCVPRPGIRSRLRL